MIFLKKISCSIMHLKTKVNTGVLEKIENQKMFRPMNCVSRKLLLNLGYNSKTKKFIR